MLLCDRREIQIGLVRDTVEAHHPLLAIPREPKQRVVLGLDRGIERERVETSGIDREETQGLPGQLESARLHQGAVHSPLVGLGDAALAEQTQGAIIAQDGAREQAVPVLALQLANAQAELEYLSPRIPLVPDVVLAGQAHGQWLMHEAIKVSLLLWQRGCAAEQVKPLPGQAAGRHAIDAVARDGDRVLFDRRLVMIRSEE